MANHPAVYHHTPDIGLFQPADWCVLEYAREDATQGYAGVFNLSGIKQEYLFRPRGVDRSSEYEVTLDNAGQKFTISGGDFANDGLHIRLDAALTSELILYGKIK